MLPLRPDFFDCCAKFERFSDRCCSSYFVPWYVVHLLNAISTMLFGEPLSLLRLRVEVTGCLWSVHPRTRFFQYMPKQLENVFQRLVFSLCSCLLMYVLSCTCPIYKDAGVGIKIDMILGGGFLKGHLPLTTDSLIVYGGSKRGKGKKKKEKGKKKKA